MQRGGAEGQPAPLRIRIKNQDRTRPNHLARLPAQSIMRRFSEALFMAHQQHQSRIEKDSMGEMQVPADAYYGAQTARAAANFPISDLRFSRRFIAAMGLIKSACASVNLELKLIDATKESLLQRAAQEVIDGKLDSQFVVDIF